MKNTPILESENESGCISGIISEPYRAMVEMILEAVKTQSNPNQIDEKNVLEYVLRKMQELSFSTEELQIFFEMFPPTIEELDLLIKQVLFLYVQLLKLMNPDDLAKLLNSPWLFYLLMQLFLISRLEAFRFLKIFRLLYRWLLYLISQGIPIKLPTIRIKLGSLIAEQMEKDDELLYLLNPLADEDIDTIIESILRVHNRLKNEVPAAIAEIVVQNEDLIYLLSLLQNEISSLQDVFGMFGTQPQLLTSVLGLKQEDAISSANSYNTSVKSYVPVQTESSIYSNSKLLMSSQYDKIESGTRVGPKNWQKKVDSYLDLIQEAESTGNLVNRIKYSISLSEVLFKHGETERATGFLKSAKDLAQNLDDPLARNEIDAMMNRARKRTLI